MDLRSFVAAACISAVLLAGCVPTSAPVAEPQQSATVTTPATPSPSSSHTATAAPELRLGSVSNFRRAFKAWTGHKLSEFRESRVLVERIVVHHPAS